MGYVVARTDGKAVHIWAAMYVGGKVSAEGMQQLRAAAKGKSVRQFTLDEWDALPVGDRDSDWVTAFNSAQLRK